MPATHPFRLSLFSRNEAFDVRVHIWNLTHSCGVRSAQECHIQGAGVTGPVVPERGFKTVLLGYWADADIFAGFDASRHIGYSTSIQIREETLRLAYVQGFAPDSKGGLAIAFHPEYFVDYCRNLEDLHRICLSPWGVEALQQVAQDDISVNSAGINTVPIEWQPVVRRIALAHIAAQFRKRVLAAYEYRCALCGLRQGPIEAAHIIPASYPSTSFETCNGVALCALHHKAFDAGLVAFSTLYETMVNDEEVMKHRNQNRQGGEAAFRENLRRLMYLPPATADKPNVNFIEQGLDIRRWPPHLR